MNVTAKSSTTTSKDLQKKYKSLPDDYRELSQSLKENPLQGVELGKGVRKIRLAISFPKAEAKVAAHAYSHSQFW